MDVQIPQHDDSVVFAVSRGELVRLVFPKICYPRIQFGNLANDFLPVASEFRLVPELSLEEGLALLFATDLHRRNHNAVRESDTMNKAKVRNDGLVGVDEVWNFGFAFDRENPAYAIPLGRDAIRFPFDVLGEAALDPA